MADIDFGTGDNTETGDTLKQALQKLQNRLPPLEASSIPLGTSMTSDGVLPLENLGRLTLVTAAGVDVTLPSPAELTDGTVVSLFFVGGAGTVNGLVVQDHGRATYLAVSETWQIVRPMTAVAGGVADPVYGAAWIDISATWNDIETPGTPSVVNVNELRFYDADGLIPVAGGTPYATTHYEDGANNFPANMAFDLDNATHWVSANVVRGPHDVLGIAWTTGKRPIRAEVHFAGQPLEYSPADFTIHVGSNADMIGGANGVQVGVHAGKFNYSTNGQILSIDLAYPAGA